VIADTAIAATPAAMTPGASNAGEPTNAINKAPKASSTTTTGNANTAADAVKGNAS